MKNEYRSWSVDLACSKAALAAGMLALVRCNGQLVDGIIIGKRVLIQIYLPVGAEHEFRELARPLKIVVPTAGGSTSALTAPPG